MRIGWLVRVLIVVVLALTIAVIFLPVRHRHEPGIRDEELAFLTVVMPGPLLSVSHLEVADRSAVQVGQAEDQRWLALGVRPGQAKVNRGIRAELSVDAPFIPGEILTYAWRFRLAAPFPADSANRWWLIAQWHDQPDPRLGETWADFPGRSPPVLIGIGEIDGVIHAGLRVGPTTAGQDQQAAGDVVIDRDRWYSASLSVRWSQGADGWVRLVIDDEEVASVTGPNLNNAYQHYWKLGMYRHPDIDGEAWIHLADVAITRPQATDHP